MRFLGERRARLKVLQESLVPERQPMAVEAPAPGAAPATPVTQERPAATTAGPVRRPIPLSPRVFAGVIGVAALITVVVAISLGSRAARPPSRDGPGISADNVPIAPIAEDDATPFAFRLRGNRDVDYDCLMTFEVTGGTPAPWQVTVHVMDSSGTVIAQDAKKVASLAPGLFIDFRFRNVDCDEIKSWQFQGETRTPRSD